MNDPMGLGPNARNMKSFLLDFFNKSESGDQLSGDAFQNAFGAYMSGAQSERGVNSAGDAGYWFHYPSQAFTDTDGARGVISKQSAFVKSSKAKRSFSFSAWERDLSNSFSNFGSGLEDMFGDGQNLQGAAQFVADLNPLMGAAHLLAKYQTGKDAYGQSMGKGGVAMAAIGLIPGENSVKVPLKFVNFIPRLFNKKLFNCVDAAIQMEKALAGKYWTPLIFNSRGGNFDKILKTVIPHPKNEIFGYL
ncbi:hypothetical protein Fleli_0195 [Bernardetia litoralis DSM 6794]|uniref:Uncharacterized protein n=1 Tax=Bernardetia litoralis (strain ATCC 23117 / DSM 6794 / NBRC 15988 / NCIMB 1366 / Fx l1 / Sio-4) TaxID=880071 RepID=I4AFF7_BERLS|nr:hypothetical protein [Bernardetia litoralis]AFM02692.1 hypothetical protein Fleli_0195 [Bernardetia litoralis DSM 6794]